MKQVLSLENIELGGLMDAANDALNKVCQDAINRPRLNKPRKITIEVMIKPEVQDLIDRSINQPSIDWQVAFSVPGNKGMTTRAFVEGDKCLINTGDPLGQAHPNQTTIFDKQ